MYYLLPQENSSFLKHEYRVRLLILTLFYASVVVWVGIVSLIPSYVLVLNQEKSALIKVASATKGSVSADVSAAMAEASTSNILSEKLASTDTGVYESAVLERIIGHRVDGIKINDIQIGHGGGNGALQASVSGVASTRDTLTAFKDSLSIDPSFTKVDLPPLALLDKAHISFHITLTITQ